MHSEILPARCYASTGICYGISVCLCVCVLHTCFVSIWLKVLLKFYHMIAPSF